ncbi:MAG: pilin [Minisyncoccia bacterium]
MRKNLLKLVSFVSLAAFFPFLAFADCVTTSGLCGVVYTIGKLLGYILPVLVALGVVYFVWGVVMYVISDSEEAKSKGRDTMIYGIIGLAVIVGLWGLVYILGVTFGINPGATNNTITNTQINNLLPPMPSQ